VKVSEVENLLEAGKRGAYFGQFLCTYRVDDKLL